MNIFELDKTYVANTYNRYPIELVKGSGSILFDKNNKRYIDMGSGIAVNTFGICDSEWISAITEQLNKLQHSSNLYYTSPCAELASLLCKRTGMKKVFFSNSGAEANECAIKAIRKYAAKNKGYDCYKIITLNNSFHGRTITTLAATGQTAFHKDFQPLTDGFIYCDANISDIAEITDRENVAAVMFEIVRGEGGVLPLEQDFINNLVELCHQKDILLVVDEVQCGNGRSGKLYSYMHYGFTPDIVTTAKGLGGGLPIGATIFSEKTQNTLGFSQHGSTFGGNPIVCAGAINIISRIDDKLLKEVNEKSNYIIEKLKNTKGINNVTGLGLMLGFKPNNPAPEIVKKCIEKGVLVLTAKEKIRLLPALNIPFDLLKEAIDIIIEVCTEE